ncbi:MAG: hypothetical protein ACM3O3_11160 [Syntrophothermus sp.]
MKYRIFVLLLLFAFTNISCSIFQTIANISRLKFKLGTVNNFRIADIPVSNKSRLSDFTAADILKVTSAIARGNLPVTFALNINAKNPNDGTGGYPSTNVQLASFPWRLLINDKETIQGNISAPISVPGTGQETVFPLTMSLDLIKFFGNGNYQDLLNLALSIGGVGGSSSKLTMFAQPTISSSIGNIKYPSEIKIVNMSYTN